MRKFVCLIIVLLFATAIQASTPTPTPSLYQGKFYMVATVTTSGDNISIPQAVATWFYQYGISYTAPDAYNGVTFTVIYNPATNAIVGASAIKLSNNAVKLVSINPLPTATVTPTRTQ